MQHPLQLSWRNVMGNDYTGMKIKFYILAMISIVKELDWTEVMSGVSRILLLKLSYSFESFYSRSPFFCSFIIKLFETSLLTFGKFMIQKTQGFRALKRMIKHSFSNNCAMDCHAGQKVQHYNIVQRFVLFTYIIGLLIKNS